MEEKRKLPAFTSTQSRWERIFAIGYLPLHLFLVPTAAALLLGGADADPVWVNFGSYAFALVFMLITQRRFLRRDFDALCDNLFGCFLQVLVSYGAMMCFNLAVGSIVALVLDGELNNPNNQAVMDLAADASGTTAALAIYIAPIVEELMFRAGVFGWLRKYSRVGAYAGSMLLFALYHVWAFALQDPVYLIYILQYLPISFLLCRCYEHTDSIWTPIFLHMMVNSVSVAALNMLGSL